MIFLRLTDVADLQAQAVPLLVTPFLVLAFMGDIWVAMFGIVPPLPDREGFEG
jgi:hypothetical protein